MSSSGRSLADSPRPPDSKACPGGDRSIPQFVDYPPTDKPLCDKMLKIVHQDMLDAMSVARLPDSHPRRVNDENRIAEMASKTLSTTLHSLEQAYDKHLHETIEYGCSTNIAAVVKNLHNGVMHKLEVNCAEKAQDGGLLVQYMLGQILDGVSSHYAEDMVQDAISVAHQMRREADEMIHAYSEQAKLELHSEK